MCECDCKILKTWAGERDSRWTQQNPSPSWPWESHVGGQEEYNVFLKWNEPAVFPLFPWNHSTVCCCWCIWTNENNTFFFCIFKSLRFFKIWISRKLKLPTFSTIAKRFHYCSKGMLYSTGKLFRAAGF